ncbi:group II intron reverse transcriptase/maturase [Elusimicrobiota bacterium]
MLETPQKILELQKKLYQKAKQEKNFRFYLLYDKVYRLDILTHAYKLVKANKGACGVDGLTFEAIEGMEAGAEGYLLMIADELRRKIYKPMPVRRVYIPKADGNKRPLGIPAIKDRIAQMATKLVIEPVFEADFQDYSYGFRPGKNAHRAMDDVSLNLRKGRVEVIDADISKYFDAIPHDKLLKKVAKRIVDKNILHLIKMWLKAPIVEEGEDGKKRHFGNHKGTPQGGVISPLLANIYLNTLDGIWKMQEIEKRLEARLVRYADDFVVLCAGNAGRVMEGVRKILKALELDINEQKTRVISSRKEGFDFLGFTSTIKKSPKTGKAFPLIRPSEKSVERIKYELKSLTSRSILHLPKERIIRKLNEAARGWANYFYYANCTESMSEVKTFLEERVRICLRRKHGNRGRGYGYKNYSNAYLYRTLGLYGIPTNAPWVRTAKALC